MRRLVTTLVEPLIGSVNLQLRVEQPLLLVIGYGAIGIAIASWWP